MPSVVTQEPNAVHKFPHGPLATTKFLRTQQGQNMFPIFPLVEVVDMIDLWFKADFSGINPGRNLFSSLDRPRLVRQELHLRPDLIQLEIRLEIHGIQRGAPLHAFRCGHNGDTPHVMCVGEETGLRSNLVCVNRIFRDWLGFGHGPNLLRKEDLSGLKSEVENLF